MWTLLSPETEMATGKILQTDGSMEHGFYLLLKMFNQQQIILI